MTKEERIKICKKCSNHILDERYGILCGLSNNFANFQDSCKDFNAMKTSAPIIERSVYKKKKKKNFGSVIGTGVLLWIIFKILLKVFKGFSE